MNRLLARVIRQLILPTWFWFVVIEAFIFTMSTTFYDIHQIVFKPYKESIDDYEVGLRSQHWDNDRIARLLREQVRVHCLVYLDVSDLKRGPRKVAHVSSTWGRRCNRLTIINSWEIPITEACGRIYSESRHELDWLLVVYLDSYVIMENLRHLLAPYSPTRAIYFSAKHIFYRYAHVGQVPSTDYVFSREALEQLSTRGCLHDDFVLEKCLGKMERGPSDGLQPFNVSENLIPFSGEKAFWIWPCAFRSVYDNQSWESCYGRAVLFPYATAKEFEALEFILYHLRPYGHVSPLPELKSASSRLNIASRPLDNILATHMFHSVRILCLVLTYPNSYMVGVRGVSETWGRHCNRVVFYSGSRLSGVKGAETVALNCSDDRNSLWIKTKAAFRHAYRHYRHEADWFYKADDDTYAIMENMRQLLRPYSPDTPIYFGCTFQLRMNLYMAGGAGYVLSRKAVELFVGETETGKKSLCPSSNAEDFSVGVCLAKLNVTVGDSLDYYRRHRFYPLTLQFFLIPDPDEDNFWLSSYLHQPCSKGIQCCSTYSISIHYVTPYQMHFLETVLYKARPYGLVVGHPPARKSRRKGSMISDVS